MVATNTRIKKAKLLEILQRNRKDHEASYDTAVEKYRALAIEQLEKQCERMRAAKAPLRVSFTLPVPEKHLSDYDRVIEMVNLDTRDEIELTEDDAAKYLMNHWEWERSFLSNTVAYAMPSPLGEEDDE